MKSLFDQIVFNFYKKDIFVLETVFFFFFFFFKVHLNPSSFVYVCLLS